MVVGRSLTSGVHSGGVAVLGKRSTRRQRRSRARGRVGRRLFVRRRRERPCGASIAAAGARVLHTTGAVAPRCPCGNTTAGRAMGGARSHKVPAPYNRATGAAGARTVPLGTACSAAQRSAAQGRPAARAAGSEGGQWTGFACPTLGGGGWGRRATTWEPGGSAWLPGGTLCVRPPAQPVPPQPLPGPGTGAQIPGN